MNNKLFILFLLIISVIILLLAINDRNNLNKIFGIGPGHIPFIDNHIITLINESHRKGIDPYKELISEYGVKLNYPPIWILIARVTNINPSHNFIIGGIFVLLYLIGFLMFSTSIKKDLILSLILIFSFFSPASILAMERGNSDILIFFLLSLTIISFKFPRIQITLLFIASLLKLYPIFLMFSLFKRENKIYFSFTILIFIIYVLYNFNNMSILQSNIPRPTRWGYGLWVIRDAIVNRFGEILLINYLNFILIVLVLLIFLLAIKVNIDISKRRKQMLEIARLNKISFLFGIIIFSTTYLLSNNFDYRLIFLIFTLPYLYNIFKKEDNFLLKSFSFLTILLILHTLYFGIFVKIFGKDIAFILDEISNLILFSLFTFWFINFLLSNQKYLKLNNGYLLQKNDIKIF